MREGLLSSHPAASFGCGKVILLGEHAVVHGTPALAAGIDRGVHARATRAEDGTSRLQIAPWGVDLVATDHDELARALRVVLEAHPKAPLPALEIEAEVALPGGAGLGCSAALGVAVIRAIDHALEHTSSDAEVAERALAWEGVFHGNPSGIDNTMAAHGGVVLYRRGQPLERVRARRPLTLVVGDSAEPSSTKTMVEGVARQRDRDPARFQTTLDAVTALTQNARLAIEAGDMRALGQLFDLNHALLSGLMLSTPALEEMIGAAREAGAHGAKLTGAGGGGCMIALAEPDTAAQIAAAIEGTGHRAFVAEVGR